METFYNYKGYGIRYISFTGTTIVERLGIVIKKFTGYGEIEGQEAAEKFIDGKVK